MLSLLFGHKVHVGLTFLQEHYLRCYCLGLVFLLCKCDLKSKPLGSPLRRPAPAPQPAPGEGSSGRARPRPRLQPRAPVPRGDEGPGR